MPPDRSTEANDGDFALECALIGGSVRLLVRYAVQGADLVEIGFKEALLGQCIQRFAHGRIVIRRPQHHMDVDALGIAVGLVGFADNDEDQRFVGALSLSGVTDMETSSLKNSNGRSRSF